MMDHSKNLIRLLLIEETLSPALRLKINEKAEILLRDLTPFVGKFLHSDLNEKHNEDDIRTLVQCVPGSLSVEGEDYRLPLESSQWKVNMHHGDKKNCMESLPFIPVLAEEGVKHEVGGRGMRGGLLHKTYGYNTLSYLTSAVNSDKVDIDPICLEVMKRLRKKKLFKKDDIHEHDLLLLSSKAGCQKRFEYLTNWYPDALKKPRDHEGGILLHLCGKCVNPRTFQTVFKSTLKRYPRELGLLFIKNNKGETPYQLMKKKRGKARAWKTVKSCLSGPASKINMHEMNPKTNLYPFLFAAAVDNSELDMVYYLLRRNPIIVERCPAKEEMASIV